MGNIFGDISASATTWKKKKNCTYDIQKPCTLPLAMTANPDNLETHKKTTSSE